jgi:hypothetical protein
MRVAVLVVALFAITVGAAGIVSPDGLTRARRHIMDTPNVVYVTGPMRVAMGLVLILFAPRSGTPTILRVPGVIMALQGIVLLFIGIDRGPLILEQEETLGIAAQRVGAVVALATGRETRHGVSTGSTEAVLNRAGAIQVAFPILTGLLMDRLSTL